MQFSRLQILQSVFLLQKIVFDNIDTRFHHALITEDKYLQALDK